MTIFGAQGKIILLFWWSYKLYCVTEKMLGLCYRLCLPTKRYAEVLIPGTCECDLIWNESIFTDIIMLISSHKGGPLIQEDQCPYKKRRQRHRGMVVMRRWSWIDADCQKLEEARKDPPLVVWREQGLVKALILKL